MTDVVVWLVGNLQWLAVGVAIGWLYSFLVSLAYGNSDSKPKDDE